MLKFFLKLLVLAVVLLSIKISLWTYLHTFRMKQFDESSYKLDSLLKPMRHRINTVFVGSSRTSHSFNPAVFDSVTHYQTRSFNHGLSAMFAPNTFAECEKLLKMDGLHLKTIFLELSFPPTLTHEDPFGRDNPLNDIAFRNSHFLRETQSGHEQVQKGISIYDSFLNHFFMLRSSVYLFALAIVRDNPENYIMTSTGFRYFRPGAFPSRLSNKIRTSSPPDTAKISHQFTDNERLYIDQLMQLVKQCNAANVAIYFYLPNRMMQEEQQILPNVYAALPDRYRIAVPFHRAFTSPFPADCSDDGKHLNRKTATRYTQSFARAFLQKAPVVAAQ
ncbi:hypothetical protein [Larkinella terrae]|uniref:DUF1574 domain-containing protein n=1 Tax=Larkinella terrae TaxID=2025311 RepID=A0A7K0EQN4_9BACT|nr:hypothetical protein [Larkinella terrae]MRS64099.1 hypothetical protein [Larkinella terrae]